MKFLFPNNIFARLLAYNFPDEFKKDIIFENAIAIAARLENEPGTVGLITPLDIVQHQNLFVSKSFGISFNGDISNSYLYFAPDKKNLTEVFLAGDITSLEAMYASIFFKEMYDVEVQLNVFNETKQLQDQNVILIGDGNFNSNHYIKGSSFGSEMIDMLEVPFVNFVFSSSDEDNIKEMNSKLEGIEQKIYTSVENNEAKLPFTEESNLLVKENISSVSYELEDQDIEGITQLIRLPYYYGKIDDIVEISFI